MKENRSLINRIEIQNYRCFKRATVVLSPFTLVIGANGAGKSNLLRFLDEAITGRKWRDNRTLLIHQHSKHYECGALGQDALLTYADGTEVNYMSGELISGSPNPTLTPLYSIDPTIIGEPETIVGDASVEPDGANAVSVLDGLKNGDREDLFVRIEKLLCNYVPSIEKLSSKTVGKGQKLLQVRERGISQPIPVSELSEGTRLLLTILTIVHQENAPSTLLLEDIDRGLHPRLYSEVVQMLRELTTEKDIQIVATTHNPYLLDQFEGDEGAVIIVEKEKGESTITTLAARLEQGDADEMPLGELWFGGFVGGYAKRSS